VKKYIEGYYCKDRGSLNAINTPIQREVLDLLRDSYPNKLTIQKISKLKKLPEATVNNIVNKLAENGFLHKGDKERTRRGKPPTGKVTGKKPAQPYLFEDLNFILNKRKNFEYQFAPGSVQYNKAFIEMYDEIADGLDQDRIFALLVQFIENAFIKMSHSTSEKVRSTAPDTKTESIFSVCGFNHEVRDFIRAMLLHNIDHLEMSDYYIKFLKNRESISSELSDELQNLSLESKSNTVDRKVQNVMTIRVLSINKGREDGSSLFLGINQDSKWVCGVIDSVLLLIHGIVVDTILECEPSVMDSNKYGIFYVKIFQMDYLKKITKDQSFPTFSKVRSKIQKIKQIGNFETLSDLFVVDAIVVKEPVISEWSVGGNILQLIDTVIADDTEMIRPVAQCNFANDLHEGHRIKVVGACAAPEFTVFGGYGGGAEYEITNSELRLSPYGSIIKSETLNPNVSGNTKTEEIIQKVQLYDDNLSRLLANVEISESRIMIIPDKTIASALTHFPTRFLIRTFEGIARKYQFALLADQINETEMFTYEMNAGDNGIITSIVINNYRDKERLDEILKLVKWSLERGLSQQ
jgi:hypothetical protein